MFLEVEKQIKIMCDRENFTDDQKILTDNYFIPSSRDQDK